MTYAGDEDTLTGMATSPDGALLVEAYCYQPERMAARYRLLIRRADGAQETVSLSYGPHVGPIEFGPGANAVRFTVRRGGRDVAVDVDARAWTFRLDGDDRPEPLAQFAERLERAFPPPRASVGSIGLPPTMRRLLGTFCGAVLALVFVAAGVWMLLGKRVTGRDRWMALLAIALFGAGAAFEIKDLLAMLRARRGRRPTPNSRS